MVNKERKIEEMRKHFPVTKEWAYFETAGTGLVPDYVYDGVRRYMDARYLRGGDSAWLYEDGEVGTLEMMNRSKEAIAKMIHGEVENIAFGLSSTQLFTMVTDGIDYEENDNIVTVLDGWIGGRFAWQKREAEDLEVRFVNPIGGVVSAELLISACDENTKAVYVNLVESSTGYRIDIDKLGEWCSKNNVLLFVDAVQALGALDVNVKKSHIDFLVGNDYKWMMNFCGTGYAYVTPRVRKMIKHWGVGWMSDTDRFNTAKSHIDIRDDAGRFEIGYPHADGIYGLGLVAEQNTLLGMKNIEEYVLSLADEFRIRAENTRGIHLTYDYPDKNRSQIVSITLDDGVKITDGDFEAAKVFAHIMAKSDGGREIRVGLHYYNNLDDIDRFFRVIEAKRKADK